jgi:hypothetical protein
MLTGGGQAWALREHALVEMYKVLCTPAGEAVRALLGPVAAAREL